MTHMAECGQLAGPSTQQSPRYLQPVPYLPTKSSDDEQVMPPPPPPPQIQQPPLETKDVIMKMADEKKNWALPPPSVATDTNEESRPAWMKVKKICNKERRRRQNQHLRRLLTPKNAVMVLNEMLPKDQVNSNTKVELVHQSPFFKQNILFQQGYCVELNIDGNAYKGYGENKASARNSAAEQAFRDILLKKMLKASQDGNSTEPEASLGDDDTIPMIQLASYALHKLFMEWEFEGHKVPLLRPCASASDAECGGSEAGDATGGSETGLETGKRSKGGPKAKKPKVLPQNASKMHPCMLMTYMRPALEYHDVAATGDRPQNMVFTVALNVDGVTYLGKASNKREARKAAARTACAQLFDVQFEPNASETVPVF